MGVLGAAGVGIAGAAAPGRDTMTKGTTPVFGGISEAYLLALKESRRIWRVM
jgi:hypothetical protein